MQLKLLKDIASNIVGPEASKIVDVLYGKKNVNEFIIAKKMKFNINQARNVLYKLADKGLVSFVRKKDSKKGGWYIYFWTLDVNKSLGLLKERISERINELKREVGMRRTKRFYYSPAINVEYTEEQALEHDFICPETGEVMQLRDSTELISPLEKEAAELSILLDKINIEKKDIEKRAEKIKQRRLRTEAYARERERLKRKKEREKLVRKLKKSPLIKKSRASKRERKKERKGMLKILRKIRTGLGKRRQVL